MPNITTLKEQLIKVGNRLYQAGMLAGTDGNLSARIDKKSILITRSGVAKGRLTTRDFVKVDLNGNVIGSKYRPSTEAAMHLTVYNERPEVWAGVHSHPPFATSFAVAGMPLEKNILPEVVLFVGEIPLIDYAPPGVGAISKAIKPYVKNHNAFLLRNHGLLTIGPSVETAFHLHETVEHFARILFLAKRLGNVNAIPEEDYARLTQLRLNRNASKISES
jgi:L-fuculose-phosphate aldolase